MKTLHAILIPIPEMVIISDVRFFTYGCQIWQMGEGQQGTDAPEWEYELARSSIL